MGLLSWILLVAGVFNLNAAQPVEVIRAIPQGEGAEAVRQITLTFNQKMVPLGQMARSAQELGITIVPVVKCQWRWLDPSNLTCQLGDQEYLRPANSYTLTLKAGLKSESGAILSKPYILNFASARPTPTYASFETWRHPGSPQIHVSFNQDVKVAEAAKLIQLDDGKSMTPVKVVPSKRKKENKAHASSFSIEPVSPLALDSEIRLKVAAGVPSATGPVLGLAKEVVTFRTFPEFRFLGIACGDEEGNPTRYKNSGEAECNPLTGVSLVFSAPSSRQEVREKLSITPPLAAKGKEDEVWGDRAYHYDGYQLSQPHSSDRTYEVRLPHFLLAKKTYHIKGSDLRDQFNRKLAAPIDFQFKTAARAPALLMKNPISVLEKNEKTEVPAYVTNLNSLTLNYSLRTASGLQNNKTHTIQIPKFEDNSFAIPIEVRKMTGGKSGAVSGSYSTDPQVFDHERKFASQVTPFQVVAKAGHQASLVWVTDLVTGKPVAGAKVRFAIQDLLSVSLAPPFLSAETDQNGLAKISGYTKWPSVATDQNYVAEVIKGQDLALLPFNHHYAASMGNNYYYYTGGYDEEGDGGTGYGNHKWGYVKSWGATAQGVYKPGEKVQFKFYVRNQSNRHFVPAPKGDYTLTILDPKGDEVFKKEAIKLNNFGAYSSEFKLAPTATVGWYSLQLRSNFHSHVMHTAGFLVADFTPVPYKVEVQLLSRRVRVGDALKIDTFATFHAGGPFANAPARLVAQFQPGYFRSEHPELKDFSFDSYSYFHNQPEILKFEGKLDAKGALHHDLVIKEMNHTFGKIVVEGAVQDDRGKNSADSSSVEYSGLDRRVGLKQTSWSNKTGEKVNLLYAVVDEAGSPAKGTKVEITFERQETKVAKVKGAGNAYLNNYTSEWKNEGSCSGTSSAHPSTCEFVPKKPGSYRAVAKITDGKRRPHSVETRLYVTGPGYVTWESGDTQALEIIPEKKEFSVGETAKFLVKNPFPGATALITVERIGVMKAWTMAMPDSATVVEVPIEDDFVPGFSLSVAITSPRVDKSDTLGQIDLGKPAARFGIARVAVSDPFKKIEIAAVTAKKEYRPRDKVQVDLTAKVLNPRTPAEPVEVAVVVLDEAVLNLIRGNEKYFNVYEGFYDSGAWDVFTYNLISMLVGRQKFEKKGANAGGAGGLSGPINMRDIFRYVAYWNPSLPVGKDGKAKFNFTLPDNLTGWRVLTMAVTPTDRMGLGQYNFKVNKPTEIRPVLPNQVTEGDKFRAGFSVLNRTDKTRKVTVRLDAEGNILGEKAKKSETSTLDLAPFERKTVFIDITASQVKESRDSLGAITFKAAAGDGADRDGLIHKMPVNKKRSFETAAAYGTTTENKVVESILFPKDIYTDVGSVSVTLAPSVIGNVEGSFKYMMQYPYICWEQKLTKGVMASHYLSLKSYLPGVQWPQAKELAQRTLDEAANFQAPSGGMAYFSPSDAFVSPYLSAYTAVAFVWLREAGYKVPDAVEGRLHGYLQNYLRSSEKTTFFDEGMRSTVRAVSLYALAKNKKVDAAEVKRFFAAMPSMSLFGQAHFMMAGMVTGGTETEQVATLRTILNKSSQTSGKFTFNETLSDGYTQLLSTPVRDNCAVLSAMVKAEKLPAQKTLVADIPFRLVRSLTQSRGSRDYFQNTQENIFCLQAMVDYSKAYEAQKPAFKATVALDGKSFGTAAFNDIVNPLKTLERLIVAGDPGRKAQVTIEREGQGRLYYATRVTFAPKEENATEINSGMDLKREYYVERGGKWQALTNLATIKRGELVRVDMFLSLPTARNFVVVSDPVAGGLEPVNRDLADTSQVDANKGNYDNHKGSLFWKRSDWREFSVNWGRFYHQELKHDFVRYYADYLPPGNYRLSYTAQAIATGEFAASPTHSEEMYDPDVFGKSTPARFTVQEK